LINTIASVELREKLHATLLEYLSVRSQGPWPLSTARAIDYVRKKIGAEELDDKMLATLIAEVAVAKSLNVSFDNVID